MIPSCLPRSSIPSMKSSAQPFHSPRRTSRSPSAIRRATARISPHVSSAVASVRTSGVLVTTTPARLRRRHVDVVVADGDVRDDLQRRRRVEHGAVDPVGQHADQRLACPASRRFSSSARSGDGPSCRSTSQAASRRREHGGRDASGEKDGGGTMRPKSTDQRSGIRDRSGISGFSVRATRSSRSDCTARPAR